MKIIDLLNKIANGEEIPHFKVGEIEYFLNWRGNLLEREEDKPSADVQWYIDEEWLNTEAEIIEEDKKIEKLVFNKDQDGDILVNGVSLIEKVNEIIDIINKEK